MLPPERWRLDTAPYSFDAQENQVGGPFVDQAGRPEAPVWSSGPFAPTSFVERPRLVTYPLPKIK
jgi:hypothetical protein